MDSMRFLSGVVTLGVSFWAYVQAGGMRNSGGLPRSNCGLEIGTLFAATDLGGPSSALLLWMAMLSFLLCRRTVHIGSSALLMTVAVLLSLSCDQSNALPLVFIAPTLGFDLLCASWSMNCAFYKARTTVQAYEQGSNFKHKDFLTHAWAGRDTPVASLEKWIVVNVMIASNVFVDVGWSWFLNFQPL